MLTESREPMIGVGVCRASLVALSVALSDSICLFVFIFFRCPEDETAGLFHFACGAPLLPSDIFPDAVVLAMIFLVVLSL